MNVSRLRALLDLILTKDADLRTHKILNAVQSNLNQLVENPQSTDAQKNFATALDQLRAKYIELRASWQPAQLPMLEEIAAKRFFYDDFSLHVTNSITMNPISPAVSKSLVDQFVSERQAYIQQITQLRDNLRVLGIEPSSLQPGQAEIGFLLPRALFDNRLDELIDELRDIQRIIRAFSEATVGSAEEVHLSDISTSDPLFGFLLSPETIASLGKAITWALDTWERVFKIRKAREEVRKSAVFTEDELDEMFSKKIKAHLESAVAEKVDALAKDDPAPGRVKEQRIDLKWALESILAHVERGMTVELRFLPPAVPRPPEGEAEKATEIAPPVFQELERLATQLAFPKMEGTPILQLPPQPKPDARNQ